MTNSYLVAAYSLVCKFPPYKIFSQMTNLPKFGSHSSSISCNFHVSETKPLERLLDLALDLY